MTKKIFFVLTFVFFINNQAVADDCSGVVVNPTILLTSSFGTLSYNHEKNTAEITDLAHSLNISETGLFAAGLSTVNIDFDIELNTMAQPVGDQAFCIIPTQIKLFLGLGSPTIYIAKELAPNSCQYNLVLHHEQVHQQINQTTLEYYLPLFKQSASKIAQSLTPLYITNTNEIKPSIKSLTETYNKKLTPLVDYIKKEMLTQQLKLDNTQNYLFESSLCP